MKIERVKGTRDFNADEMSGRLHLQGKLTEVFERYGYRRIATPVFEHVELFSLKSGDEIETHMYSFDDKKGRTLCLRPEATAPVCRMYCESLRGEALPVKLYYFEPMYRYEEPQKGRYREFWQLGLELIGPGSIVSDAEIIILAQECLRSVGLEHTLEIGHLGVVRGLLRDIGIEGASQSRVIACIDKGDIEGVRQVTCDETLLKLIGLSGGRDVLENAMELLADHSDALRAVNELTELCGLLDAAGAGYTIKLGVARGLDYYTGMVFEIRVPCLGAQNQICGGGRYDGLIELFSGSPMPAVGFAFGFDRVLEAMEAQGIELPPAKRGIYIAPIGDVKKEAQAIAGTLRGDHIVETDLMDRKLGRIMEHASLRGARYVVIVGRKDLDAGLLTVRDMDSGEQEQVKVGDIETYMREKLL